jgi:hypothetical protein
VFASFFPYPELALIRNHSGLRVETIQQLCEAQKHILVATDYLSEGINLPVLIYFGYHSKSTKVVHKIPITGINIVMYPPGKF